MKDNKTYKAIKASERNPNVERYYWTNLGSTYWHNDIKEWGVELNQVTYWLEEQEQEQGEDIRDILIDFIADWYKDNPTVSKEKIIKMADNYLAKFPNGQPKQVTLKEANV